ncbi:FHA domain-containing protein [Streptomyces sp. NPDC007264]|uniref:FHA domain-containing protein n=1 Tax=Streptomyces sp. NPDC007264 TaxID=3364777 RepID=UPI0036DB3D9B
MSDEFDDELDGLELFDTRKGIRPDELRDRAEPGDGPGPATQAQAAAPPHLAPGMAVRLFFPRADICLDVPLGGELRLGRDDSWAPRAAPLFKGERTVSARHAVVTCADDGTLAVAEVPRGSRNGVKVDTRILTPGNPEPLRRGDTVWLGPWVSFTVQDPMGVLEP